MKQKHKISHWIIGALVLVIIILGAGYLRQSGMIRSLASRAASSPKVTVKLAVGQRYYLGQAYLHGTCDVVCTNMYSVTGSAVSLYSVAAANPLYPDSSDVYAVAVSSGTGNVLNVFTASHPCPTGGGTCGIGNQKYYNFIIGGSAVND